MMTRADLQPWIEEREREADGIAVLAPGYLAAMKSRIMDRDMTGLAMLSFSYAMAHGVQTNEILKACREITFTKGEGYAGSGDFLANFYRVGRREGISPISVAAVYMWKHIDWLDTYETTGVAHGSEGLASRITDIILYAALCRAIQIREEGKSS